MQVTIDEIAQKIYEERYSKPAQPEIAVYLRDGMVREVVQRALELAIGGLAVDLVEIRRDRNAARETVTAWLIAAAERCEYPLAEQAPGWIAYECAEDAWHVAIAKLDSWIAGQEK